MADDKRSIAATAPADDRLPLGAQLSHGLGAVAFGVKEVGFTTFLLIYFNQVLGFDSRIVSLVLVAALLVDAVVDPLIGHLGDATRSRWGRRLPWLYLAPFPLALAWIVLWNPPDFMPHSVLSLFVMAVLVRALVSACEIPSVALVPELTQGYDERTRLARFRFLFGWIGGFITTAAAYGWFLKESAGNPLGVLGAQGYAGFGMFGAALMLASVVISAMLQHRRVAKPSPPVDAAATRLSTSDEMRSLWETLRHRAFRPLATAGLFAYTSQGVNFVIINYLFLYAMRLPDFAIQAYPLVLLVAVVLAFVLVVPMHQRWGKRATAVALSLFTAAVWAAPFLLRMGGISPADGTNASVIFFFAFMMVALCTNIIVTISQSSMVADVVEAYEAETGVRKECTFYAGNFLINKCSSALGIFLTGQIVALAGLSERMRPQDVSQSASDRLVLMYLAVIIITGLAAAWFYRQYPITREQHEARLANR